MGTYLLKRLLLFIPTAFGVSVIIFVMLHSIPGDYAVALLLGDVEDQITASEEDFERISAGNWAWTARYTCNTSVG